MMPKINPGERPADDLRPGDPAAAPEAVAIVLARGGSRGLPGKNSRHVAGRPCVEWTLRAALACTRVAAVGLSTDDTAMLALARALAAASAGRVVPIARPPTLARDDTPVDDAARHALSVLISAGRTEPRAVIILYGNVPVRPADLLDRALDLLMSSNADSVQSYAPAGKHHPWWTARLDPESGTLRPWDGPVLNHGVFRRQDLPPAYIPDGGVIALTPRALNLQIQGLPAAGPHAFLGQDRRGIATRPGDVVDIDDAIDLLVADAILSGRAAGLLGPSASAHPSVASEPAPIRTKTHAA